MFELSSAVAGAVKNFMIYLVDQNIFILGKILLYPRVYCFILSCYMFFSYNHINYSFKNLFTSNFYDYIIYSYLGHCDVIREIPCS